MAKGVWKSLSGFLFINLKKFLKKPFLLNIRFLVSKKRQLETFEHTKYYE